MKIGILTFHCAHNYGAVLQCYALQEYLKEVGHDVEVIDYRPHYLLEPYNIFKKTRVISKNPIRMAKNIVWEIILLYYRYKRHSSFNSFIKNKLKLSQRVEKDKIPETYEAYIIGSDQVWNTSITQGFDKIHFAYFPFPKKEKKYLSYAASMGETYLSPEKEEYMKIALNNFDYLSVRENDMVDLLQPLVKSPITQVLDPTLLINASIWEKLIHNPNIKNKYVLVYQVRVNEQTLKIAQQIANQIGGIVIEAVAYINRNCRKNNYQTASPQDFLSLIKHAACVVTTSFHGTAFSVIFNRPFYTIYLNDGRDSRSCSLLEAVELKNRIITLHEVPTFEPINFEQANNKLEDLRKQSRAFLNSSLQ